MIEKHGFRLRKSMSFPTEFVCNRISEIKDMVTYYINIVKKTPVIFWRFNISYSIYAPINSSYCSGVNKASTSERSVGSITTIQACS